MGLGVAARSESQGVSSTSFFRLLSLLRLLLLSLLLPRLLLFLPPPLVSLLLPLLSSSRLFPLILHLTLVLPRRRIFRRILLLTQFLVFWIRVWLRCLRLLVRSFVVCQPLSSIYFRRLRVLPLFLLLRVLFLKTVSPPLLLLR